MGLVMNMVVMSSTSLSQLKDLFMGLKGRISITPGGSLTVSADNCCCGQQSETLKDLISEGCGISKHLITTQLDGFHACMRLVRSCDPRCPMFCQFARDLSKAMYMVSTGDLESLRASRAQRGHKNPPSKEELRRSVKRCISAPPVLRERITQVAHTYYEIDKQVEKQRSGKEDLKSRALLTSSFWPSLAGLLGHVDRNCLSDGKPDVYVRDSNGNLIWRRGSSKSEARHSSLLRDFFCLSRISADYVDAKLLWRVCYSNRSLLHELTSVKTMPIPFSAREVSWACSDSSQIHVVFGDSPVVFGSEYLRKQDSKLPDSVFQQWCDDDGDEGDEGLILAGEDDLGIDVYRQVTNFEDIDVNDDGDIVVDGTPSSSGIADGEEFVALCNSPRNKKHLQISGVRSRIISIPLDGWTDLVKQKINDIVASMPRDHVREEFVLQQYDRMILDEINSAMKNEVEAVPLHRISFNDLKAYLSKLRNYETASASTIQGMEALTRLRVSLDGDAIHKPPANPAIIEGAGGPPSPVPKPVITDQLRRQGHGTSVPASAAKPGFSATSSGNGQAKENRKSNMICRWCHIPLSTREFNMYIDDGSRYGRCPCAPLPDTLTEKAKLYAQERVKSLVVEDIRGKGRRCGICMLPMISSIMDMTTGQFLPDHERFYDSEKRSVWYCPVRQNLDAGVLQDLRNLKVRRWKEQQEKKNQNKRRRYHENNG